MSESPGRTLLAAVSALAAMVGVVVAIDIWRQRDRSAEDSANSDGDPGEGIDFEDAIGSWHSIDGYTLQLPTTFQGDDCWDQHVDLDDQGASAPFDDGSPAAEWADLIWSSCGGRLTGHLYSPSVSGVAAAGAGIAPELCSTANGGSYPPFAMTINPSRLEAEVGCLITGSGAIATFFVASAEWVGDAVEAELRVRLWLREE